MALHISVQSAYSPLSGSQILPNLEQTEAVHVVVDAVVDVVEEVEEAAAVEEAEVVVVQAAVAVQEAAAVEEAVAVAVVAQEVVAVAVVEEAVADKKIILDHTTSLFNINTIEQRTFIICMNSCIGNDLYTP